MPGFAMFSALAAATALFLAADAEAAPIAPVGTTDVTVDAGVLQFLTDNSIAPSPIAPAAQSDATFSFPITGGDTDTLRIDHSGGVRLETGANFVEISDFVIDGTGGTVSGTVFGSAAAYTSPVMADLFTLDSVVLGSPITADLLISTALNDALGSTFAGGTDLGLRGGLFGSASTAPQAAPIPLPAGAPLLLAGLGAFAMLRRRTA